MPKKALSEEKLFEAAALVVGCAPNELRAVKPQGVSVTVIDGSFRKLSFKLDELEAVLKAEAAKKRRKTAAAKKAAGKSGK